MRDRTSKQKSKSPFAQNLKSILAERGITQKAAAELADVPPSTVGDWLSGVMPTDPLAVQRLCRALKTDVEWLLTGQKGQSDFSGVPLSEIFDITDEPDFSGFFEISARRLKKKSGDRKT